MLVGPGDDAAAVRAARRPLLFTTDSLIEGIHFRRGWETWAGLGRRAFTVNASDVAAMGGVPRYALLALEIPGGTPVAEIDALVAGFAGAARRTGARLIGGNVAGGPHLAITVALVGEAPGRVITRGGARPGDVLFVTGNLGATGIAVRSLTAGRHGRLPALPLRVRAGVLLARVAHAMIDVSDGLSTDLSHILDESNVSARIFPDRIPASDGAGVDDVLHGGEDYELLIVAPSLPAQIEGVPLTRIGEIVPSVADNRIVRISGGGETVLQPRGFEHFR